MKINIEWKKANNKERMNERNKKENIDQEWKQNIKERETAGKQRIQRKKLNKWESFK